MKKQLIALSFLSSVAFAGSTAPKFDVLEFTPAGLPAQSSRSICAANNLKPMIEEPEETQALGTPIGQYREDGFFGASGKCTGTLISNDLFLTAKHCLGTTCDKIKVAFNYLKGRAEEEVFACKEIVEKGDTSEENDYMIIRLEGSPGVKFDYYPPAATPAQAKDELMMIHHPSGTPMKLSLDECAVHEIKGKMLHHRCDTEPGSSGSAILTRDLETGEMSRIVGVHTMGGCSTTKEDTSNSGPTMSHLMEISPTLKSLAKK